MTKRETNATRLKAGFEEWLENMGHVYSQDDYDDPANHEERLDWYQWYWYQWCEDEDRTMLYLDKPYEELEEEYQEAECDICYYCNEMVPLDHLVMDPVSVAEARCDDYRDGSYVCPDCIKVGYKINVPEMQPIDSGKIPGSV